MFRSLLLHHRSRRRGYTLIEILVVAVIIVLMLGMAVPVFRVINGSRSEAGATNVIAAMLNRARTDAIGIQQPYGVAFIYDTVKQQSYMAEVYFPPTIAYSASGSFGAIISVPPYAYISETLPPSVVSAPPYPTYLINSTGVTQQLGIENTWATFIFGQPLDIVPDTDVVPLPSGIGVQTVCNCNLSRNGERTGNGYLQVGVILFDAKGRLTSMLYAISQFSNLGRATQMTSSYPTKGNIGALKGNELIAQGVYSQFGVVVYQQQAYVSNRSPLQPEALYTDRTLPGNPPLPDYTNASSTPTQQQADSWLDQNATPLLIDRYTGTLIKAE